MAMRVAMLGVRMLAHRPFDLTNGDDRQEANEQQEQREKQSEAPYQHTYVDPSWGEVTPAGWQEIAAERRTGNHKTFKPHTDVHEDRDDPHQYRVGAEDPEPK